MIRKDLIASRRTVARFHVRLAAFYLVGFFAFLITGSIVDRYLEVAHPIAHSILVLALVPVLLLSAMLLIWQLNRSFKKANLLCPSCKARLDGSNGQVAVATGNCGECGSHIIED